MNEMSRTGHRRRAGGIAALCLAVCLLALNAYLASIRRSASSDVARLERTRNNLKEMADQLEVTSRQAESDRRIILDVLGQCRTAEDIPDLASHRVVARRQGLEKLCIYVPSGSHTLAISSKWKRTAKEDQSTAVNAGDSGGDGEKTWRVPLFGDCGYVLQIESDRTGGPIRWELTSNHPDFETRAETIPVDRFFHQVSSWSGEDVVQFPNQIQWYSISELETAAAAPRGTNVMNSVLNGLCDDQAYEIAIHVQIFSDLPACVSASDAQRIIVLGRADLLDYVGGGKYLIRAPDGAQSTKN